MPPDARPLAADAPVKYLGSWVGGKRVGRGALLQFGACAFSCSVYVDGARLLHRHAFGGYTPFDVCVISTDLG